jgi:all-trans-retinol 13,14-reductase
MELKDSYDTVVIGAGLGGLACGAYLSKNNQSILVAERRSQPGGSASYTEQEGYYSDNGLFFLVQAEPGGIIYDTLEELGLRQRLELIKMKPAMRIIGPDYDLPINSPESFENLIKDFPMEADPIRRFVEESKSAATESEFIMRKSFDLMSPLQKIVFFITLLLRYRRFMKYMRKSWLEVVNGFFKSPRLRAIALSTMCYYGTGVMGTMISTLGFTDKFNYPKGGFQAVANLLVDGIREHGGDLTLDTMVTKIIIDDNKAIGVELSNGRQVWARNIVSNVDARQTFLKLVGEDHLSMKFRKKLDEEELSPPGFLVSLGVNMNLKEMGFDSAIIIYNPNDDIDELFGTDPEKCILSILMHSNIDHSRAPENATAVDLLAVLPYDLVEDWEVEEEAIADKLIKSAEKIIPELSEHVVCKHIVSPLAYEQSTLNSQGGTLGWKQ